MASCSVQLSSRRPDPANRRIDAAESRTPNQISHQPRYRTIDQLLCARQTFASPRPAIVLAENCTSIRSSRERQGGGSSSPRSAKTSSAQRPAGYAAVNFKVSGTVERPKTDLMDKLVGRDLRDLGGVINSLFGHAKKKKKPAEEVTPSPTPIASPNDIAPTPALSEPTAPAPPYEIAPEPSASPTPSPESHRGPRRIRLFVPKTTFANDGSRKSRIFSSLGDLYRRAGARSIRRNGRSASKTSVAAPPGHVVESDRHAIAAIERTRPGPLSGRVRKHYVFDFSAHASTAEPQD